MIKLFITDLDGCISYPFRSPDWEAITKIKEWNFLSKTDSTVPPLTICTGRPLPYAEAVAQWLDIELPFVFESGGGLYDFPNNQIVWNPDFDKQAQAHISEIKYWLQTEVIDKYEGSIPEFSKFTDAGLINPDTDKIERMFAQVVPHIAHNYKEFEVHKTDVSINIILRKTNKGAGIRMLCDTLGMGIHEVAYIGDSSGDIPGLLIVGKPFAPANAVKQVKDVSVVTENESTKGVLEVYNSLVAYNRGI